MKTKKLILAVIILAVVAGAVWFFLPKGQPEMGSRWITSVVKSENISQSVTATGTIEPVTKVDIGTQVSGILTKLYVDYNSVVKQGQVIAELDRSTLIIEVNNNRSNVELAQSKYNYEKANFNRKKSLYAQNLISDSEYEQALYSYETAKGSLEISENTLKRSETNLGYTTIYSPIDGVVLSRSVEEGQTVASSFSTPTLFTVAADLKDMRLIVDIDEADIGNVAEGQKATFSVDAFPLETFEGIVTQVRQEATVASNVVTYEVVISAANPDLKLKPGMTANVEVFVLNKKCPLSVPLSALSFNPKLPEGRAPRKEIEGSKVWVKDAERIKPQGVTVGVNNGIVSEVIDGLQIGDTVVTGQQEMLQDAAMMQRGGGAAGEKSANESPFMPQRPGRKK